jgi:D-amino-acid oxidase
MRTRHVTVVGAGVIGLTTALELQARGFEVTVVSRDRPENTTSSVAAALWFPYKAAPVERVTGWAIRTLERFRSLSRDAQTGVRWTVGTELHRAVVPEPAWLKYVDRAPPPSLPPGFHTARRFSVPVVEMPRFLAYLLERFTTGGGRLELRVLSTLHELPKTDRVVCCAGLGARELVPDTSLLPVRGQIIRVWCPSISEFLLDEDHPDGPLYVIPRGTDCIVGGTAEEGIESLEPSARTTADILARAARHVPELAQATILDTRVGLRPVRPSVRLEPDSDRNSHVLFNYGHGGSGVTLCWGCAEEVANLAQTLAFS